jgi:hypothetical protein
MSKHEDKDSVNAYIVVTALKGLPKPNIEKNASKELFKVFAADDHPKKPTPNKLKGQ